MMSFDVVTAAAGLLCAWCGVALILYEVRLAQEAREMREEEWDG